MYWVNYSFKWLFAYYVYTLYNLTHLGAHLWCLKNYFSSALQKLGHNLLYCDCVPSLCVSFRWRTSCCMTKDIMCYVILAVPLTAPRIHKQKVWRLLKKKSRSEHCLFLSIIHHSVTFSYQLNLILCVCFKVHYSFIPGPRNGESIWGQSYHY